jgi:hypothetical protein
MPPDLRLTKEGVTQHGLFYLVFANPRNGHILGSRSEVAMQFLPTFCPDCKGLTMEVVEYEPDDSYEARCNRLWLLPPRQDFARAPDYEARYRQPSEGN